MTAELRHWRPGDEDALVSICDEVEVAFRTPLASPFTVEDARAYVAGRDGYLDLAIAEADGPAVGLMSINLSTRSASYVVGAHARRRGLAASALSLAGQLARTDLAFDRLFLEIEPDNSASISVAERCGFQPSDVPVELVEDKGRTYALATWELILQ